MIMNKNVYVGAADALGSDRRWRSSRATEVPNLLQGALLNESLASPSTRGQRRQRCTLVFRITSHHLAFDNRVASQLLCTGSTVSINACG